MQKIQQYDFHAPRPILDFSRQAFKYGTISKRSPSPNWKRKHQILKTNYWNIAGRIITTIVTIIIIILATFIIDQIATSIVLTQVKPSFTSSICRIIFISITVSHSDTLQSKIPKSFAWFSDCSTKITNINCIKTLSPRFFLTTQDNFWSNAICLTN